MMSDPPQPPSSGSTSGAFFADSASAATKRTFTPSSSSNDAFSQRAPFDRTDSRGQHRLAALPPAEIANNLATIGMRARSAVGKGFAVDASRARSPEEQQATLGGGGSSNAHAASLNDSSRAVFARTQSMPIWQRSNTEVRPFCESGSGLDDLDEDRESIASSSMKRRADDAAAGIDFNNMQSGGGNDDDVLGDFMSDDEDGEGAADAQMDLGLEGSTATPAPFGASTERAQAPFPKRTFRTAQTMPVSSNVAAHLNSAAARPRRFRDDNDFRWQAHTEEFSRGAKGDVEF